VSVEERIVEQAAREQGYRGPQVCAIVGITYRQLDYWARTDLLRPSLADARGSGTQRLYSYRDLLELKVIKQLLDAGLNLREARRALDCLRQSGDDLATANLVLGAAGTVLARSGEEIVDLLRGGQGVFNIVPLAGVVGEVDAAIVGLDQPRAGSSPRSGAGDVAGAPPSSDQRAATGS
jgi:DNA-binding transcriptional MerR regulator